MMFFFKKKTFESSFLLENKSYKVFFLQNLDFTKSFFRHNNKIPLWMFGLLY